MWTYFRQPEMRGRTYGELDALFERKVSARKFATTHVDQFHGDDSDRRTMVDVAEKKEGNKTERWVENEQQAA